MGKGKRIKSGLADVTYKKRSKTKDRPADYVSGSSINWFPGHMAKALRKVKDNLQKVNIVLEIRDARLPLTSGNESLHEVSGNKHRLIILNKVDLAEEGNVKLWEEWFEKQDTPYLFLNSFEGVTIKKLMELSRHIVESKKEKENKKLNLRMMIIGVPNTGKSTIINQMASKKATKAANTPGLTRNQQWVNLADGIQLMDTPGIMPPTIHTDEQGHWLCAIHAIKDDIIGEDQVAYFVVTHLLTKDFYKENLKKFYKIETLPDDPMEVIEEIGRIRNFVKKGGVVDLNRVYKIILFDFRKGDLGQCSFEIPPKS